MRTPETLVQHELTGLQVEVVEASNPTLVGIDGVVIRETMQTLYIAPSLEASDDADVKQVPKHGTTFVFSVNEEAVRVDGSILVARPADRTRNRGDSAWV